MIQYLIGTIGVISAVLGIISFVFYIQHPLSHTNHVSYAGGKFWLVAFICLLALYVKG